MLGKTGAGKSSALRHIVEHLLRENKRVCIIDPKGDWWGLKSSADGKGAGFPVIAFGDFKGQRQGDIPINERAGKHVADLVASGNRPCIIGFSGWTITAMTEFWIHFAEGIFSQNQGELYIIGDEFHNFAPKGSLKGKEGRGAMSLHWSNRLLSEGRGIGIVCLLASQRPAKVHNDTLTSCETLIAMRVTHAADRRAYEDWIDGCGDETQGREVIASVASMPRADAYVWSPEIGFGPKRVTFPMFKTFDSFAPPQLQKKVSQSGWAAVNLDEVKVKLATVIEEEKANDPGELKRKLQEAERKLRIAEQKAPETQQPAEIVTRTLPLFGDGTAKDIEDMAFTLNQKGTEMLSKAVEISDLLKEVRGQVASMAQNQPKPRFDSETSITRVRYAPTPSPRQFAKATNGDEGELTGMGRKMLTALAQHPEGLTKGQILTHAAYASSGPVSTTFGLLNRMGWTQSNGTILQITAEGRKVLGAYEPLPTGKALQEHVLNKAIPMERAFLTVIFEVYPGTITKGELLERTGYASSGPVSTTFARLVRLGWVKAQGKSVLKANDDFFK